MAWLQPDVARRRPEVIPSIRILVGLERPRKW